jgi:hypothetical protein
MRTIILLIFLLSCTKCVFGQTRKTLDSWIGSSKKELMSAWGLPEKEGSDGEGGTIIAYRSTDFRGEKWVSFNLDSRNVVYGWSTNPIPAQNINVTSNPSGFRVFRTQRR